WAGALSAPLAERLPHTCPRLDLSQGSILLPEMAQDLRISLLRGAALAGNEGSRSLLLEFGGQTVLLCGDAEEAGLAAQLRNRLFPGPCAALLAPHHGSASGHIGALLDICAPALVWISGSGVPGLAAELDRRAIRWRSTADSGSIAWRPP
ncbi:MAG: hypothetical protein ABI054_04995, partial [Planctomycetota bacterium]